jgi:hypothetical protein
MRVKHLVKKNKMVKGKAVNAATSWVPSAFTQKDLDKAKADDLISDSDSVIFPSTELVLQYRHTVRTRISTSITIGPSLMGLRGTQLTGSIIYTLVRLVPENA